VIADALFQTAAGISTAQAAALSLVAQHRGCSQRRLADELRQRESAITAMVQRLETAGLVERRASAADARAWQLWPTAAGLEALTRLDQALAGVNRFLEGAVGREAIDGFTDALEALERAAVRRS
jgi:DNA-binding MarR family transcriptional regulator